MRRRRAKTWEWASAVAGQGDAPSMQRSSRRLSRSQRRRGARAPPHRFHPPRPPAANYTEDVRPRHRLWNHVQKDAACVSLCKDFARRDSDCRGARDKFISGDERDMLRTREELEEIEARTLASYAMPAAMSRGRRAPEPPHPMRTCFQRDRDRIIHSAAFRRLEYKTQVFVNHEGDYYRTRLTHTLEAAQITRTLARALGLNGDLAEAVVLAHDLGHTPFGHAGEKMLNDLMRGHGGFDHNAQSLRTVDWIEVRYPHFRGLNLTYEVREGIIKHSAFKGRAAAQEFDPALYPCLEAQIVDLADEIAYLAHDADDGVEAAMLTAKDLEASRIYRAARSAIDAQITDER